MAFAMCLRPETIQKVSMSEFPTVVQARAHGPLSLAVLESSSDDRGTVLTGTNLCTTDFQLDHPLSTFAPTWQRVVAALQFAFLTDSKAGTMDTSVVDRKELPDCTMETLTVWTYTMQCSCPIRCSRKRITACYRTHLLPHAGTTRLSDPTVVELAVAFRGTASSRCWTPPEARDSVQMLEKVRGGAADHPSSPLASPGVFVGAPVVHKVEF